MPQATDWLDRLHSHWVPGQYKDPQHKEAVVSTTDHCLLESLPCHLCITLPCHLDVLPDPASHGPALSPCCLTHPCLVALLTLISLIHWPGPLDCISQLLILTTSSTQRWLASNSVWTPGYPTTHTYLTIALACFRSYSYYKISAFYFSWIKHFYTIYSLGRMASL